MNLEGQKGRVGERVSYDQSSCPNGASKQTFDPQLIMFGETEAQKKTHQQWQK